jgi:hypothetical protein
MSNTELLFKEIEGLPPDYVGEILDFVGYLKHKAAPVNVEPQKTFKPMPTIEELKREAEERAARERETGYNPFEGLKGCMKDSPCFAGRTGEEIQRELRDEWN